MTTRPVFGIDLGASSASVAFVDASGEVAFIPNAQGELSTPTALFFRDKDSFVVGQAANDAMAGDHARYVSDVKQALGKPGWQFEAFGKPYLAQELAACPALPTTWSKPPPSRCVTWSCLPRVLRTRKVPRPGRLAARRWHVLGTSRTRPPRRTRSACEAADRSSSFDLSART